jgi:hypothetical protein
MLNLQMNFRGLKSLSKDIRWSMIVHFAITSRFTLSLGEFYSFLLNAWKLFSFKIVFFLRKFRNRNVHEIWVSCFVTLVSVSYI